MCVPTSQMIRQVRGKCDAWEWYEDKIVKHASTPRVCARASSKTLLAGKVVWGNGTVVIKELNCFAFSRDLDAIN